MKNWNKGIKECYITFHNENKVELMGLLMSDIMGIQGAIVNGVEISITMIPNTDNIHLQSFKNNTYGRIVIDDIYVMHQQDCLLSCQLRLTFPPSWRECG